jgi:hypothetical protein
VRRTTAVFVSGPPASGKSTFARGLARRLNMSFVDLDTLSEPFLRPYLAQYPGYKDSQEYRDSMRDREYEALMRLVLDNLEVGIGCVAVAPFSKERTSTDFPPGYMKDVLRVGDGTEAVAEIWVRTVGVVISITPEQQRFNLQRRGAKRDIKKLECWDEYSCTFAGRLGGQLSSAGDSWAVDIKLTVEFENLKNSFSNEIGRIAALINQSLHNPE